MEKLEKLEKFESFKVKNESLNFIVGGKEVGATGAGEVCVMGVCHAYSSDQHVNGGIEYNIIHPVDKSC